jgi:two-component system response regulator YesN
MTRVDAPAAAAALRRDPDRRRIFRKFLLAYGVVLAVPAALAIALYGGLVRQAERFVAERTLAGLRQTQSTVDEYLAEMRWNAIRIAGNAKLRFLLAAARAGTPVSNYHVREVIDVLFDDIAYRDDFTTTCFIYIGNGSLVLTPESAYRPAYFFEEVVRGIDAGAMASWHEAASSRYYHGRFFRSLSVQVDPTGPYLRVIPFVQSLPIGYNRDPEGYVAYLIDEDRVQRLLGRVEVPARGWMCIVDDTGTVLTAINRDSDELSGSLPVLDGEEGYAECRLEGAAMLVTFVTSTENGWRYVAALPTSFVRDMIHNIRIMSWMFFGLLLAVGIGCAWAFAASYSRPVAGLIRDRGVLQHTLQGKTEFVRDLLFERLLKGRIGDRDELETMLAQSEVRADARRWLIVLIRTKAEQDLADGAQLDRIRLCHALLRDRAPHVFRGPCLVHRMDRETSVLLLGLDGAEVSACLEQAETGVRQLATGLPTDRSVRLDCAGGEPFTDLLGAHHCYEQALQALDGSREPVARGIDGARVAWFTEVRASARGYYYPLEMESRLLDAMRAGDRLKAAGILVDLHRENFASRRLPLEEQRMLLHELRGTIHKVPDTRGDGERLAAAVERANAPAAVLEAFGELRDRCLQLCDLAGTERPSHAQALTAAILHHLEERYRDPQLTLRSVAGRFGLTEAYLSAFFKERCGVTFSRHVAKLRVDRASRLLEETNLSIGAIASDVGYNSDKAFRRAFKRARSVSPRGFRVRRSARGSAEPEAAIARLSSLRAP